MLIMQESDCVPHFLSLLNSSLPVIVHERATRWTWRDFLAFFRCSIALPNNVEISNEEEKHPLAFSIIAHGDARSHSNSNTLLHNLNHQCHLCTIVITNVTRQLELLLASIYRPFNHYCLFIDPR